MQYKIHRNKGFHKKSCRYWYQYISISNRSLLILCVTYHNIGSYLGSMVIISLVTWTQVSVHGTINVINLYMHVPYFFWGSIVCIHFKIISHSGFYWFKFTLKIGTANSKCLCQERLLELLIQTTVWQSQWFDYILCRLG